MINLCKSVTMQTGPIIKLAIDIHKIDKYFPLDYNLQGGLEYDMNIERQRFEEVTALLNEYDISDSKIIQEFCFISIWIEKEIRASDERNSLSGDFYQMWLELDNLKQYLLNNRITEISFKGEYERNQPGKTLTLKEEINIDRICDGIRSIFSNEFNYKKTKKGTGGQLTWKRKKMEMVKNNILKYLVTIPELDSLSFESQFYIIGYLSALAGFYKSEEDFNSSRKEMKQYESYRDYLIQNVKGLK
jgi:hypothetical protein